LIGIPETDLLGFVVFNCGSEKSGKWWGPGRNRRWSRYQLSFWLSLAKI